MPLPILDPCCPGAAGFRRGEHRRIILEEKSMAKHEEKISESAGRRPIQDLREWLQRVAALGQLIQVKDPVGCEEEMSAISYLVAKHNSLPAIKFDEFRGSDESSYSAVAAWNILGPS